MVHHPPAVVGPPAAGLVPRTTRPTSASTRPRARAGSAIPTCSTRGSARRCGRSRRSAGRRRRPSCAPSIRPTCCSTARDILFLWVARMVMMGIEFAGDIPFDARLRPLGHPGARRPADEQVARHRHRPDGPHRGRRRIPGLRRRRGALRAAGDVLDAGRALQRGEGRAGPRAREQALQRVAAGPDERRARRGRAAAADASRTAGSSPPAARGRRGARAIEAFEFHKLSLGLYDFVYGELCDWYLELFKARVARRAT